MGRKREYVIGNKYGRITITDCEPDGCSPNGSSYRIVKYLCECGNVGTARLSDIKRGNTMSCGCLFKDTFIKHGFDSCDSKYKRIYHIYHDIKKRCYNENSHAYKDYGGRGIKMCDEWLENFKSFASWCLSNGYLDCLTIDRIDNNGDYKPSNCRWTTIQEQANNKRNNIIVSKNGLSMTATQWCRYLGLNIGTYKSRRRMGWDVEKSLFTHVRKH